MNPQVRHFTEKLLQDLRANPDVPAHSAIQAVLLGSIKLNLSTDECRGVLDILRMEYGIGRQRWSEIILHLLKAMPEEFQATTHPKIITP
jgi:hypothetical protein